MTPKVNFLPSGKVVEAKAGETLLEVALRNDISMGHACGGFCACTTCHIEVRSGDSALSSMEEDEEERLDRLVGGQTLHSRLGCQARLKAMSNSSEITIEVMNPDGPSH